MNVIKPHNNKIQRSDISLDKRVASSLVQMVLAGQSIFTSAGAKGRVELTLEGGEVVEIPRSTISNWIKRNNVVPETGETLRSILDKAREKLRASEREKRQNMMLNEAEKEMHRTLRIRTNVPVVGMFGVVKDENGNIVRKEHSGLLKTKMETAKFLAERLDPNRYAQQTNVKGSHLIFSLADLRSASQGEPVQVEVE